VEFFNNAQAINTRLHQLELLPGFGKKHTKEVLDARKEKAFESSMTSGRETNQFLIQKKLSKNGSSKN
jgi:predicted nucleic acid-binding OB-fold protein